MTEENKLITERKKKLEEIKKNHYAVDGTPADCVHIVSKGILEKLPDIVFSGINFGSNLGDDVISVSYTHLTLPTKA